MNLILVAEDDFVSLTRARLTGRRLAYVRQVHRAEVGDTLRVGQLNGLVGTGLVTALGDDALELEISLERPPPPPARARVLLALPRPKALRRVLQCLAAMGVKDIVLFNTWRVEKSFWRSPALMPEALREQLWLGLEQGGDTVLPVISTRRRFRPFVEDELPALARGSLALVAHPTAEQPCPRASGAPLTLAVGPEGGFIAYELDALRAAGCAAVSLGPRPLRVEHAVPALLGRLL
ncbi:MAG: 16S rRNA (uracil(1498)-N(3))-methyltransferase [Candidatus Binatia bacterium]